MQPRARAALLLVAVAIAVASLATCGGGDDVPPMGEPQTAAIDAAPRRAPRPRQRAVPAPAVPPSAIGRSGGAAVVVDPDASALLGSGAAGWAEVSTTPPADGRTTGRLRVLMLRDGRPFEGGHVCFVAAERFVEPGAWDGTSCSDGAYFGLPMYTAM